MSPTGNEDNIFFENYNPLIITKNWWLLWCSNTSCRQQNLLMIYWADSLLLLKHIFEQLPQENKCPALQLSRTWICYLGTIVARTCGLKYETEKYLEEQSAKIFTKLCLYHSCMYLIQTFALPMQRNQRSGTILTE